MYLYTKHLNIIKEVWSSITLLINFAQLISNFMDYKENNMVLRYDSVNIIAIKDKWKL